MRTPDGRRRQDRRGGDRPVVGEHERPGSARDRSRLHQIYYQNKFSPSGGEFDVDRNAGCGMNVTNKPVEHIVWPKGAAPIGEYRVFVDHFANCGAGDPTPYTVEIVADGKRQTFQGTIAKGQPRQPVATFTRPAAAPPPGAVPGSWPPWWRESWAGRSSARLAWASPRAHPPLRRLAAQRGHRRRHRRRGGRTGLCRPDRGRPGRRPGTASSAWSSSGRASDCGSSSSSGCCRRCWRCDRAGSRVARFSWTSRKCGWAERLPGDLPGRRRRDRGPSRDGSQGSALHVLVQEAGQVSVNGAPVTRHVLQDGDALLPGKTRLVYKRKGTRRPNVGNHAAAPQRRRPLFAPSHSFNCPSPRPEVRGCRRPRRARHPGRAARATSRPGQNTSASTAHSGKASPPASPPAKPAGSMGGSPTPAADKPGPRSTPPQPPSAGPKLPPPPPPGSKQCSIRPIPPPEAK